MRSLMCHDVAKGLISRDNGVVYDLCRYWLTMIGRSMGTN